MCGASGPSSAQNDQINRQNEMQRDQFNQSQALAREQAEFARQNAADNLAFQREQALAAQANADASLGISRQGLSMQQGEIQRQIEREMEREATITGSVDAVNKAFQGRQNIFTDLKNDTLALNTEALDDTRNDANRNLGFALNRAGRRFDSLEIDKSAQINERYNEGLLDANTFASSVANGAKAQDASLRQALLGSAASGQFDGQELVAGASGSLDAIAGTEGGLSGSAANRSYFNDIPNSINQLAGLFAGNTGSNSGAPQFRPGSSGGGSSGRVSNTGV